MKKFFLVWWLIGLLIAGCGDSSSSDDKYGNEPRNGWVKVWEEDDVYKRCDNNTMVYYYDGMITTIPNSSECSG